MKKHLLLSFCILSFSILFAQDERYSFGKVPPTQLTMTTYDEDTSAVAVILHDYGRLAVASGNSDYTQIFSRCRRIKILKKGGLDYGNIEVYKFLIISR
ncbi:MAG: hypothetical protein ACI85O_001143 [Saprospiraceae bacterium]|jgi:hypothetical protein